MALTAKQQVNQAAVAQRKATAAANAAAKKSAAQAKKQPTTVTSTGGNLAVNPGPNNTEVINSQGYGTSTVGNWLLSLGNLFNGNSQSQADLTANQQQAQALQDENNPDTPTLTFTPISGAQTTSTLIGGEPDDSTDVTDQGTSGISLTSVFTYALLAVAALFLIHHFHRKN